MWACFGRVVLLSESTFAIPCHMTDLNRYRREASSLFIEIYGSVLLGHGILPKYGTRLYHNWKCHCIWPLTKHAHIVPTLLFFSYFSSPSYYFARGDGNCA